jgi:hypothetical protein
MALILLCFNVLRREEESHRLANIKAETPEKSNNDNNKNEMPSLWSISGTSKAYQESATAKWRNKAGKPVD